MRSLAAQLDASRVDPVQTATSDSAVYQNSTAGNEICLHLDFSRCYMCFLGICCPQEEARNQYSRLGDKTVPLAVLTGIWVS